MWTAELLKDLPRGRDMLRLTRSSTLLLNWKGIEPALEILSSSPTSGKVSSSGSSFLPHSSSETSFLHHEFGLRQVTEEPVNGDGE